MEEKKCECGMPLNKETTCKCNDKLCIHCCECDADCVCGCAKKAEEDEGDEEGNCACCAHKDHCDEK